MKEYENLKLDNQLCFALYRATNSITRLYRKLLNEHNLTYPQYLVLLVLWEQDGVAIKDVITRLNLDSGTLSPIIKRLNQAELIKKERIDQDERIVRLFLTDKARKLKSIVASIQKDVACHTQLSSTQFFDLIEQLTELDNQVNQPSIEPARDYDIT